MNSPDGGTRPPREARKRFLDPVERVSEILFGLIMTLTFTGSLSAGETGRAEIRTMLLGVLGCNLAWGVVDAVMFLMNGLTERSRDAMTLRRIRHTTDAAEAGRIVAGVLPSVVADVLDPPALAALQEKIRRGPEPPSSVVPRREEWIAAAGVFLLVVISTFPPVLPFIFLTDVTAALRLSNLVAIVMLFLCGYSLGRYAGRKPWLTGTVMVLVGLVLVGMTIALGG